MRHKALLISASVMVLAVGLVVASCGSSGGGSTGESATTTEAAGATTTAATGTGAQVAMKNIAFDPASVTINAGEKVTWTNEDSVPHTVVGDNGEFESDTLAKGDTFSFTFDQAGTYAYHCSIHPNMRGTVIVQ